MSNNISVTYFDTAMILIEGGGVRLLTDPVLYPAGSAFDGCVAKIIFKRESSSSAFR